MSRTRVGAAALAALILVGCNRPIRVQPEIIEDAQLMARVKTMLVNDRQLGTRIIEVRVDGRVVTLSGLVASTEEAERAVSLARNVPGVTAVRSQLVVRELSELNAMAADAAVRDVTVRAMQDEASASQRRLLAVGASINTRDPRSDRLASSLSLGPLVRIGYGGGLGITAGFNWFRSDLSGADGGTLGRITIRPVMGGVSYTFTDQTRWSLSPSLVGGVAFNSFTFDEVIVVADVLALEVDNSPVMRPGVSLWIDFNSRAALNFFTGYVVTRPQVTFLESGRLTKRPVRADTAVVSVGLVYKLF